MTELRTSLPPSGWVELSLSDDGGTYTTRASAVIGVLARPDGATVDLMSHVTLAVRESAADVLAAVAAAETSTRTRKPGAAAGRSRLERRMSESLKAAIIMAYNNGEEIRTAAKRMGVSVGTIMRVAREMDLPSRKPGPKKVLKSKDVTT